MAFAQNLKHLMDIRGLSKYKLAKILDCHQTTVQNWLEGSEPQKRSQLALANYFRITVSELMGDELPYPKNEKKPLPIGEELTGIQREAMELIKEMSDEQLQIFVATLKATRGN